MSIERRTRIDVELESVGQFDRTQRWRGKLDVTLEFDGRVRIGKPTQAGFQALLFNAEDLIEAISLAADGSPEHSTEPER